MSSSDSAPRLTSLSHGGGCGCKISPAILADLLKGTAAAAPCAALLVGTETGDDAAVYQLNDTQALVATTDFFMPIVDDPFDFGRIAATNALSDVYAMGGRPVLALALLAMPVAILRAEVIREVLAGGEAACAAAGVPIAGGHSIDSVEPIYGLAALGLVHPGHVRRNCSARGGDALILGKPLGVGILSAALKKAALSGEGYRQLIDTTTRLNSAGPDLAALPGVHAMTDVTGFGLLGHLLGMCRGARLGARISLSRVPELQGVRALLAAGYVTGASARNWASYGDEVRLARELTPLDRAVLCDPQTSGGLLIACAEDTVPAALGILEREGCPQAAVIGAMTEGSPRIEVES
ncbi:MAG TPA: selenide, water dikinase SelD [Steroidobacteraceae bacterium]|nr:selenide, water dikinase SelD [Steroidobacteraceae bacterium]